MPRVTRPFADRHQWTTPTFAEGSTVPLPRTCKREGCPVIESVSEAGPRGGRKKFYTAPSGEGVVRYDGGAPACKGAPWRQPVG